MKPETHVGIDTLLCGEPLELGAARAVLKLTATEQMRADAYGLVHGGFVFGLADHAAMLAINEPTVVLGAAEVRMLLPVRIGDQLVAEAKVERDEGKKRIVAVDVKRAGQSVMTGVFTCFVPPHHVLAGDGERS